MEAFLTIGSLGFWIMTVVAFIALFGAMEARSWLGGLFTLVVFSAAFSAWGEGLEVGRWLYKHPTHVIVTIISYLAIGAVWGLARWWLEVRKLARNMQEEYHSVKTAFLAKHLNITVVTSETPIPNELRQQWAATIYGIIRPPQVREHKTDILTWMAFWPISVLWTLLSDFLKEVFENIYSSLVKTLQEISNKAFKDLLTAKMVDDLGSEKLGEMKGPQ